MPTADAVIIGAGIVGTACADRLSRDGLRVTVLEQDLVGGGATAAGMGHIVVMDDSEAQFALTRYSQQLWAEISDALTPAVEYQTCGTLWVAADEEEMAEVRRKCAFYTERGVPAQVVSPADLAGMEPNLRAGLAGALLVPEDAVVYPPAAARLFLDRAMQRGASVRTNCRVLQVEEGIVRLERESISSPAIINATGVGGSTLMPMLQIKPRKGHLVITDRYPGFVKHQLVELGYLKSAHSVTADSVAFNVQPRATGQILIGSSRQFGALQTAVEQPVLSRMLRRALEYMPSLGPVSAIRTWTGFRAATPDKLPCIGRLPESETLYAACGHEGLGITTSLGTAALVADQIQGRESRIPCEPYLPGRAFVEPAHA